MNAGKTVKLLAIASVGGHWSELVRIIPPNLAETELVYVSTHPKCESMTEGCPFHTIRDFSRWDAYLCVPVFFQAICILRKVKPDAVVSTGAAPGLIALFAARLLGKKAIWIDSVANVRRLSLSGKIASKFASQTYTQWESLATSRVKYAGSIFDEGDQQ